MGVKKLYRLPKAAVSSLLKGFMTGYSQSRTLDVSCEAQEVRVQQHVPPTHRTGAQCFSPSLKEEPAGKNRLMGSLPGLRQAVEFFIQAFVQQTS